MVSPQEKYPYKAMILAAGLGTRLRPLTDTIPKALVKVGGQTLLERAIQHLSDFGVTDIIINVHHFPDSIIQYLDQNEDFGVNITVSDERDDLLDTGGGLKKASWFFDDGHPFIVRNVDVISDLDLHGLMEDHQRTDALATLAIRNRETFRYFLFDHDQQLCGWTNLKTGEKIVSRKSTEDLKMLAFSGIQALSPEIFDLITEEGKFSLTDMYLRLSSNQKIIGFIDTSDVWKDVGKIEAIY
jgi:NDP-sugar pyrophosphorylase family protein